MTLKKNPSLWLCIGMDLLGSLSYALPIWGEWFDIVFAPISAFMFYLLFGGRVGKIGAIVNFTEEIMPFIDIIPTFTLAYFYIKLTNKSDLNI